MDMCSKNQYLHRLLLQAGGYHLKSKKEKGIILDEYCRITGQNRKYVIRKIRTGSYIPDQTIGRKTCRKRKKYYNSYVVAALIKCWKIFDYPCGQRLSPVLKTEVDRLRRLKELYCSDEVAGKLKEITPSTIDKKLSREKEVLHLRRRYSKKNNPLLYQQIPVNPSWQQSRRVLGNLQIDLVEHCGNSVSGEYICTLSNTDIATGWWEGEAVMGKSQRAVFGALKRQRNRFPFSWNSIHTDSGTEFINHSLFEYTESEKIGFSRSRPYRKNDNCFVEQKNWTHVKKFVGCRRYDTKEELNILNKLYQKELRLYKNFFQPVMKLKKKVRIGGKIIRKYEEPKTPYHRLIDSKAVSRKTKSQLQKIYESLNPAELKRVIDKKRWQLYKVYQNKKDRS